MPRPFPDDIAPQLAQACAVIRRHLSTSILAIHLYGSALGGGLRPLSDIDLLVTLDAPPDEPMRWALLLDLLPVSAPPGTHPSLRALEVTVVTRDDVAPWRQPARRVLQFGEWLREDLQADVFESPVFDPDLAILLTQARQRSIALVGAEADAVFDPVPAQDFRRALAETVGQWRQPADWAGDERNIVLALARVWYSAATGGIAAKDEAARWAEARVADEHRPVLRAARLAYLGRAADNLADRPQAVAAFIAYAQEQVMTALEA